MKNLGILFIFFAAITIQAQNEKSESVLLDSRDGKKYKTVKIGEQVWMAENLAYKPASGNYWAYNNEVDNIAVYGYLYDFQTAKNACPSGWHLPSNDEWTKLTEYLGGEEGDVGGKLKETGTTHWTSPNTGATNSSGFTALPGGRRYLDDNFYAMGNIGFWWSATKYAKKDAFGIRLDYNQGGKMRIGEYVVLGFSVRCVRD